MPSASAAARRPCRTEAVFRGRRLGAVAADECGALAERAVVEQRFGLDPHRGGIGDISRRVGHAERVASTLGAGVAPVGVKAIEVATIENA